jgi:hypothetical protein
MISPERCVRINKVRYAGWLARRDAGLGDGHFLQDVSPIAKFPAMVN